VGSVAVVLWAVSGISDWTLIVDKQFGLPVTWLGFGEHKRALR